MLIGSFDALAYISNVGKNRLFVAFPETLRRWNLVTLRPAGQEIGMVAV